MVCSSRSIASLESPVAAAGGISSLPHVKASGLRPAPLVLRPSRKFQFSQPSRLIPMAMAGEKFEKSGVIVERDPPESRLKELGVRSWGKWGCGPSKFPWTYSDKETCYLLKGDVIVTPDGGEDVHIKAKDLVIFPAGMGCVWDVKETVDKHFKFG
eukprot:jgi/Mesvir1/23953/Mv10722-RA.1